MNDPNKASKNKTELRGLEGAMIEAAEIVVSMAWENKWKPALISFMNRKEACELGVNTLSRLNDVDETDLAYRNA